MFAWILKTKPLSFSSCACTIRSLVARGPRRGCMLDERRQQLLDSEIVDRGTEEHRRLAAGEIGFPVELRRGAAHQLDLVVKRGGALAQEFARRGAAEPVDHAVGAGAALFTRRVDVDAVLEQVVDALQVAAHADRPGHRRAGDLQHVLDLVEQRRSARGRRGRAC